MATDKKFFEQLNTKTLGDNDAETIQALSNPVHLQKSNLELLEAINLVNEASFRTDGGIIPGTVAVKVGSFTDNEQITVLTPAAGEVWQILFPIAKVTSGSVSTSVGYEMWIKDNATSVLYRIYYYASTSSSPIPNEDASIWGAPLFIGEGQSLVGEIGSFSGTTIDWGVLAGRVR